MSLRAKPPKVLARHIVPVHGKSVQRAITGHLLGERSAGMAEVGELHSAA
jgi:hypothetical protein